jgi:hypothetical protein
MGIRLSRTDIHMTAKGLQMPRGLAFERWAETGHRLSRMSTGSAWSLGDWLLYGQHAYGKRYRQAIANTGFDYQTLRNYAWVARAFELSRRRDTLSFQHHSEVAALPEPEQDLWLQRAAAGRWSRNELRRHLVAHRGTRATDEPQPVVVRIAVSPQSEERWQRAAAVQQRDLLDWLIAVADAAADSALAPEPAVPRPVSHLRDGERPRDRGRLTPVSA